MKTSSSSIFLKLFLYYFENKNKNPPTNQALKYPQIHIFEKINNKVRDVKLLI